MGSNITQYDNIMSKETEQLVEGINIVGRVLSSVHDQREGVGKNGPYKVDAIKTMLICGNTVVSISEDRASVPTSRVREQGELVRIHPQPSFADNGVLTFRGRIE